MNHSSTTPIPRRDYAPEHCPEVRDEPFATFRLWFNYAQSRGVLEPEAMALATTASDLLPSCRMVLLKHFDDRGFSFFTNLESPKALDLKHNPQAALCWYWKEINLQVRAQGPCLAVTSEESAAYFAQRPRGAQISAWASKQSAPLASREELEQAASNYEQKFCDKQVPLPPNWGGFRLEPKEIEFWCGAQDRKHHRWLFALAGDQWSRKMLYP